MDYVRGCFPKLSNTGNPCYGSIEVKHMFLNISRKSRNFDWSFIEMGGFLMRKLYRSYSMDLEISPGTHKYLRAKFF